MLSKNRKIKDIPRALRPREKLIKYGPAKLSSAELLALILSSGRPGFNVLKLAEKILKQSKNKGLQNLEFSNFLKIPGIGLAKSCQLIAVFELGKRFLGGGQNKIYLNPQDIFNELRDIRNQKKEHLIAFYLDARCQEIKKEIISIGTINKNLIHPREIFEPAIRYLSTSVILAHNHPSGSCLPSKEDIAITKLLKKAGNILGIEILDHIIVSSSDFLSLKQEKMI